MVQKINQPVSIQQLKLERASLGAETSVQFGELLKEQLKDSPEVRFSKHAAARVEQRGIEMKDTLLRDLNRAVDKAREKGSKDVIVIGEQSAFIVNVPNNVVVTTMSIREMKQNIFTNIDSAVLL